MNGHLIRRLRLGSGPLKRMTDRLQEVSRVVVLGAVLAAVPLGAAVGGSVSGMLHATQHAQAAARTTRPATLLVEAPAASSPDGGDVLVQGRWAGPHGPVTGEVMAPGGAPAGSTVTVWVDLAGRLTTEPLLDGDIVVQSATAGTVAALALPALALLLHLLVVGLLDRARLRRWTVEWASVEPLWADRAA